MTMRSDAQKVEGKGRDEDRECDGRTALREAWKEWEENGEQQQKHRNWRLVIENIVRET